MIGPLGAILIVGVYQTVRDSIRRRTPIPMGRSRLPTKVGQSFDGGSLQELRLSLVVIASRFREVWHVRLDHRLCRGYTSCPNRGCILRDSHRDPGDPQKSGVS